MIRHLEDLTVLTETQFILPVRKAERHTINVPFYLYLYLPSRTALVFKKEAVRKATDI